MSSEEYHSVLRKLNNKNRKVVMFLVLHFKLSSQHSLVSYFLSISTSLCSLFHSSIFSLSSFLCLSTIPSFSFDQFSVLLGKDFKFNSVSKAPLACGSSALLPSPCYLCNTLCDCCTLTFPCSNDVHVLQTDASSVGISGILSVYWSRLFPAATWSGERYTAMELECLAVLSAIKHLEVYLHGISFTVENRSQGSGILVVI